MSVPKGRRKESKFEAIHHFYGLRKEVTDLLMSEFGFSEKKYLETIEHYRKGHEKGCGEDKIDAVVDRYETRLNGFQTWYIQEERTAILNILRKIESEFTMANSIYPSETPARMAEFCERRKHINDAIALCYCLKQEIQYVICTLPVNINRFERFSEMIDHQIALYKGVRKADNRFLKQKPDQNKQKDIDNITDKNSVVNNSKPKDTLKNNPYQNIPTYQQVSTNNVSQSQRVPNTSKMNISNFNNNGNTIGAIRPPLPGQKPFQG